MEAARRARKNLAKAHTRDSLQALSKLGELADGQYRIVSQPPVIVPARHLAATFGLSPDEVIPALHDQSARTGPPCKTTAAACWSGSRSSTWRARSSGSMTLPLALAQFIAGYPVTNMNVAIGAIAKDPGTSVAGVQTAITQFTPHHGGADDTG